MDYDGTLPAVSTGADLCQIATVSSANGIEEAVRGRVNVVLIVLGDGTTYQGAKQRRVRRQESSKFFSYT